MNDQEMYEMQLKIGELLTEDHADNEILLGYLLLKIFRNSVIGYQAGAIVSDALELEKEIRKCALAHAMGKK